MFSIAIITGVMVTTIPCTVARFHASITELVLFYIFPLLIQRLGHELRTGMEQMLSVEAKHTQKNCTSLGWPFILNVCSSLSTENTGSVPFCVSEILFLSGWF